MIKKLPQQVYEQIKAGEVIEDPSCVVRELIDNSIDAQSTLIEIEITNGGMSLISIKDNGIGMSPEDLEICFLEHTTSKIQKFEDIFNLQTAGFRGEALASICHIAKVSITSATKEMDQTHTIEIQQAEILDRSFAAHRRGSLIKVKEIFYNTPVKQKFLKSKARETSKIKKEIFTKALAHPEIGFSLKVDGKSQMIASENQLIEDRISQLLNITPPFIHVSHKQEDFSLKGILSNSHQTFSSSGFLYFFVNHKPFVSKSFYGVLNKALSDLIPRNQYLGGCLYIYTHTKNIDPNVHPSKKEVKIFIENQILHRLYSIIKNAFYSNASTQEPFIASVETPLESLSPETPSLQNSPNFNYSQLDENSKSHISSFSFSKNKATETPEISPIVTQDLFTKKTSSPSTEQESIVPQYPFQFLGTAFGTYWIVQKENQLYFIDFHAAHERKRYEKLKQNVKDNPSIESQILLTPEILQISPKDFYLVEQMEDNFKSLGFDIQVLGDNILSVKAIPSFYKNQNWKEDLFEFFDKLYSTEVKLEEFKDYILKRMACRGSYMSQDSVPQEEINYLLVEIFSHKFPLTCPHGRPFIFDLKKNYIESQFLRA